MTEVTVIDAGCKDNAGYDVAGKIASGISEYEDSSGAVLIRSVSSINDITIKRPDILVLTEDAARACGERQKHISCGILLLPGDANADIFDAACIVTYGMSPKNTITLSSISEETCVLAIQRELVTTTGDVLERQEIKIKGGMHPECLLAVAGTLLLLGLRLSDLNP